MLGTFGTMAIAACLTQGFIRPGLKRYSAWKNDPDRVQVAGRDWRGNYVPDLKLKRIERALWVCLVAFVAFSVVVTIAFFANPSAGIPQFERAT